MALGNDYVDQDTIMKNDNNRALPENENIGNMGNMGNMGNIGDAQNVDPKVIQPNVQNEKKINGKINQHNKENIKNKWKQGENNDAKNPFFFNGKLLKYYYFFLFPKFEDSIILIFLVILVLLFIIKKKCY
jgi:hypothetical protein